jgi:hypothetical protein
MIGIGDIYEVRHRDKDNGGKNDLREVAEQAGLEHLQECRSCRESKQDYLGK